MNRRRITTGNSRPAVRIPETVGISKTLWPNSSVSPWFLCLSVNPMSGPCYRTPVLYGHRCVLGVWVVRRILANPFGELHALICHSCHCPCSQDEASSFRVTGKPQDPLLLGRHSERPTLAAPHIHLTAVQIRVASLRANHLILQTISLLTDFLMLYWIIIYI